MKTFSRAAWSSTASVILISVSAALGQPGIITQPLTQNKVDGSAATLSVSANNPSIPLPSVTSGTLRLWLKSDVGVVTNASGQVSVWQDQSGHTNDASQSAQAQQPLLTVGIGSRPVLRFNGLSPDIGDFLHGSGDLGLSAGYTSFFAYSTPYSGSRVTVITMVGTALDYNSVRSSYLLNGDLGFSAWGNDYLSSSPISSNTFRIWTDRLSDDLATNEIFDTDGTNSAHVTQSVGNLAPPQPGYFIAGLGDDSRSMPCDIGEMIYYAGSLSEPDRLAVANYLQQKYYGGGTNNGLSYQWQFDEANIAGATNSMLTLANVQLTNSGTYDVIVSNSTGRVVSSNALLTVGYAPTINSQPQDQEVVQGTNVSFTVAADGTAPLAYQWYFNGGTISQETNSTLALDNVGETADGSYTVSVTSPFGSTLSSNAVLKVDLVPSFGMQPQSQSEAVGSSVTFSVANAALPPVSSGTLRLWLKSDVGVVTNASGQVSVWQDQSGHTNNASQTAQAQQPLLTVGIGSRPVLRFNGLSPGIGDFLHGAGDLGLSAGYTSFFAYSTPYSGSRVTVITMVGTVLDYNSVRTSYLLNSDLGFSAWGNDYLSSSPISSNKFRIWTDRLSDNLATNEIFDTDGTNSAHVTQRVGNLAPPQPGYFIAGLGDSSRSMPCDIGEMIYYAGSLSETDRLAVANYLQQKYYSGGNIEGSVTNGLSYQWQFDGTNIAGATNSTLTLVNVQLTNSGTYTVTATNLAGFVTSSNAILTVGLAPGFSVQPVSQSVAAGLGATFTASASGTGPDSYQWMFNGAPITNATNASLSLTDITTNAAGNYTVTVTSPFGTDLSSNAVLTVLVPTVQIGNISTSGGSTITVPVQLVALGTESGLTFSLDFDPTILTYTAAVVGNSDPGSLYLLANTHQLTSGHLGITVSLTGGAFPAGTNEVAEVTFQVAVLTNTATTPLTFGAQPTPQVISDAQGNPLLPVIYLPGAVSIAEVAVEGDVWPVSSGDNMVTVSDWVQEGRFVAGLDTITNSSEFQRADCAPRSAGGDGEITVADWVQVGRYAAGLDLPTAVGVLPDQTAVRAAPTKTAEPRSISIVPITQGALTNTVAVQLTAQGGENSIGFSLSFDPAAARFVSASLGTGATGAVLFQNTAKAASGQLGFVLGFNLLSAPTSFAAGIQQVIRLNFASVSYSNTVALNFSDAPVVRGLVDVNADLPAANYQSILLPVSGASWPALSVDNSGAQSTLSWAASSGFVLESTSSLGGPWTPVVGTLSTNGNNVTFAPPASSGQTFYRLQHQ